MDFEINQGESRLEYERYFEDHDIGLVDGVVSSMMQDQDFILIDGKIVATQSMVINWWMLYILSRKLLEGNKVMIERDEENIISTAFGESLQSKILENGGMYLPNFIDMISENFTSLPNSDLFP